MNVKKGIKKYLGILSVFWIMGGFIGAYLLTTDYKMVFDLNNVHFVELLYAALVVNVLAFAMIPPYKAPIDWYLEVMGKVFLNVGLFHMGNFVINRLGVADSKFIQFVLCVTPALLIDVMFFVVKDSVATAKYNMIKDKNIQGIVGKHFQNRVVLFQTEQEDRDVVDLISDIVDVAVIETEEDKSLINMYLDRFKFAKDGEYRFIHVLGNDEGTYDVIPTSAIPMKEECDDFIRNHAHLFGGIDNVLEKLK